MRGVFRFAIPCDAPCSGRCLRAGAPTTKEYTHVGGEAPPSVDASGYDRYPCALPLLLETPTPDPLIPPPRREGPRLDVLITPLRSRTSRSHFRTGGPNGIRPHTGRSAALHRRVRESPGAGPADLLRSAGKLRHTQASCKPHGIFADTRGRFTFSAGKTEELTTKTGQTMVVPVGEYLLENLSDQPLEVVPVES
jgi:hypothetical protein